MVMERPQGTRLAFVMGTYVQASRNELVKQMLETDAQWLFLVDDDHTFDRRLLINLLDRRVDVVGSLSLPRKPPYFVCTHTKVDTITGHRKRAGLNPKGKATPEGLQPVGWHDLRHTAISRRIAAGLDVKTVQRMAGHAKPSITLDLYSHEFEKAARSDDLRNRLMAASSPLLQVTARASYR
jgi:integrase